MSRNPLLVYITIGIALIAPLIVMIWSLQLGALLLAIGMLLTTQLVRRLRRRPDYGDQVMQRYDSRPDEYSNTIYVQLIDDHGNELDPVSAAERMAEAAERAGPHDVVIGVKRKV